MATQQPVGLTPCKLSVRRATERRNFLAEEINETLMADAEGSLEEAVAEHPMIAECAVVGIADADKGQVPLGMVLLKDGVNIGGAELEGELVQMVRKAVGAFANFKRAVVVQRLPKTRSGKILRQVLRKMIDGVSYSIPSTIDDPGIIPEIEAVLKQEGVM